MLKFSGINISSYDTKKMTVFYRDKLGLNVIGDEFEKGRDYDSYDGNVCLIFDHDDLEKLYAELKEKGVALDPPKTADWGGQELVMKDPDGNTIIVL